MLTRWRKRRARLSAARARAEAYAADPHAGLKLADHFPDEAWPALHQVVAGYRAIRDEIDPAPLLETFALEQARLCLPCVIAPDAPLAFRVWSPGEPCVRGAFGVEEPDPSAPETRPVLMLVPLLAFDAEGRRLGYGAGYYDRTIEALSGLGPVTTVGLAYDAQRMNRVPTGAHDRRLDWVVTERGAWKTDA